MATAALASVPTTISTAESTTGWTGDTFSLEPDIKVQGSNSVACVITPNAGSSQEIYYTGFTAADLSAVHLRMWFNISFVGNLSTTSPVRVFISDGTNTAYWDIDVSAYAGGWMQAVVYTGNTPDSGTKPTGNSTRVGMRFAVATKPRNVPANSWFDAWYYGDGYTVTGGTSGDEIDWSHIAAVDKTSAYNIVSEIDEVYFLRGAITIGDGTLTTYFKPQGQLCMFADEPVNSTLYELKIYDDASEVTNVEMIGGAISAAGTQDYKVTLTPTEARLTKIDGISIAKSGLIVLPNYDATKRYVKNSVFDNCGNINVDTTIFEANIIKNATLGLLWDHSGSNYMADNKYLDNTDALKVEIKQNLTLDGDLFSGNTYDIWFSGNCSIITAGSFTIGNAYKIVTVGTTDFTLIGSADNVVGTKFVATGVGSGTGTASEVLLINKTGGADPSTYRATGTNGDVLITATFNHILTGLEQNTEVTYVLAGTATEIFHVENASVSDGAGKYKTTFVHAGGQSVDILIHHVSYLPDISNIYTLTLPNADATVKVAMFEDLNYFNPT